MTNGTLLRHVIDDVITSIRQTIDDAEVTRVMVGFWVITTANRLLSQHIGKRDSGQFMTTWTGIPVVEPTTTQQTGVVAYRKYIELPQRIFDFDFDAGINYIAYVSDGSPGCPPEFEFVNFERTSPKEARMLTWHPQTKPSPRRPYFYRTGDYIPLLGIENINVQSVEIGIFSTIKPITDINEDDPFFFPEELMSILRLQVLNLGRLVLQIPGDNRDNTGNDETTTNTQVPNQKLTSVSDQNTDL